MRAAASGRHVLRALTDPPPHFPSLLLPLVTALAVAGFTPLTRDPAARAETLFLAVLAGVVMASIAALTAQGPSAGRRLAEGVAFGVVAVTWLAHHEPHRGALLSALLFFGWTGAVAMAWRSQSQGLPDDRRGLSPGLTIPAVLGLQVLQRGDLLLPPHFDPRSLVSLLVLPTVAGLCLSLLSRHFEASRVAIAGAAVAVLAPGFNVTTTLALVALTAGAEAGKDSCPDRWRWALLAGLTALPLWDPTVGMLCAIGGLSLALGNRMAFVPVILALGLAALAQGDRDRLEALHWWFGGLSLVPAALLAPLDGRWRLRQGAVLLLAAALVGDTWGALAPGIALVALATPVKGAPVAVQRGFSFAVLVGTTLLAAYPWMRRAPRTDTMAILDMPPKGPDLMLPFVLVVGTGVLLDILRRSVGTNLLRRLPTGTMNALGTGIALVALMGLAVWPMGSVRVWVHSYGAVSLSAEQPLFRLELDGQPTSEWILDTNLVQSLGLSTGDKVATVVLLDSDGQTLAEWPIRVGRDSAEWAAARPDIAARPGFVTPDPWLSQVAPDGTFFAQRFRIRFQRAEPLRASALEIRRNGDLPPEPTLMLYRLESRP